MSFTMLNRADEVKDVPIMTKVKPGTYEGDATMGSQTNSTNGYEYIRTNIRLSEKLANKANFEDGDRVSLLKGTGRDSGKLRIVHNSKGGHTLVAENSSLIVRTTKLLSKKIKTRAVKVTSIASGALTLAY